MSEFFRALERAERERAQRGSAAARLLPPRPAPTPVERRPAAEPPPADREAPVPPAPPRVVAARSVARAAAVAAPRVDEPVAAPPAADGLDEHLVSLLRPASFEAEQYRVLRHVVEDRRRAGDFSVVAVTSPGPAEGKTLTALNLAAALAQDRGARVLVVDADLRKPAVHRALGLPEAGERGLADAILHPHLGLDDVVARRAILPLAFVPAGRAVSAPYELLKAPRFAELLATARREYDWVVLDTPPAVPFPDCRILRDVVDGFFVVVAAHKTSQGMLADTLDIMEPGKVIGLVFNGDDAPTTAYGTDRYRGAESLAWR